MANLVYIISFQKPVIYIVVYLHFNSDTLIILKYCVFLTVVRM